MKEFNLGGAIFGFFSAYWNLALWAVTVAVGGYAVWKLVFEREDGLRDARAAMTSRQGEHGLLRRAGRIIVRMFGNWQLALLGATSLVLSLASGWTTWDGMKNFTKEPVLSLMATFGIQGVMLITAWLIGETFARGATGEGHDGHGSSGDLRFDRDSIKRGAMAAAESSKIYVFLLIGIVVLFGLALGIAAVLGVEGMSELRSQFGTTVTWTSVSLGSVLLVAFVLIAFSNAEILGPYARGARVILANLHLWIMMLACMGTSVFFSFDSLFTSIFPQEERVRAADIRSISQVQATVADIGGLIQKRQMEEAEKLFSLPSWQSYEKQLDAVAKLSEKAPTLIREQITRELEAQKSRIASLEEKRATAQGGQASLTTRKAVLVEDLSRLQGQRPNEAAESQTDKAKVTEIERTFDEQRVKSAAEERGVEGSGKQGRGQFFRASKAEEEKLGDQLKIAKERLKNSEGRLIATDRKLSTIKAELAQIDGALANLKGEAETAGQLITVAQTDKSTDAAHKFDPAAGVGALERERQSFRQKPEQAMLASIQNSCAAMLGAAGKVPSLQDDAARVDCDPKEASEAAGRVFALNAGILAFSSNCVGSDKLPQEGGTTALLSYGRKCLQDSGLGSKDSALVAQRLASTDLNRDDKAHRFVVTWNAFLDGNRLAYLALAIAIALDGLVFMSGLFGANAIASPLSNTPEAKRRSVHDLEKVIYSAMRPEPVNVADLAVNLMEPVRLPQYPGFSVFVDLNPLVDQSQKFAVRKVLTAGSGLGLVTHVGEYPSIYLIRRELHEYMLKVSGDEHDRGRRPDPAIAIPQLDPSLSMARAFLSHYTRMIPQSRGPSQFAGGSAGMRDVTPYAQPGTSLPHMPSRPNLSPPAAAAGFNGSGSHGMAAPPASSQPYLRHAAEQAHNGNGGASTGRGPVNGLSHGSESAHTGRNGYAPVPPALGPTPVPDRRSRMDFLPPDNDADADGEVEPTNDIFLAPYLEELRITQSDYNALKSPKLQEQIRDASYAIEGLAKADERLGGRIRRLIELKRGSLKILKNREPDSRELAEDLYNDFPVLLLFGSNGYRKIVDALVEQMERDPDGIESPSGDGKLSASDYDRYQYLSKHRGELTRLWTNDRHSGSTWTSLTAEIERLAQELGEVRAVEEIKDHSQQQRAPYVN